MSQKDLSKTIPYGDLGIIPLESSKAIGKMRCIAFFGKNF